MSEIFKHKGVTAGTMPFVKTEEPMGNMHNDPDIAQADIRKQLTNLIRIRNISLSLDNHHYISLKYIYEWLESTATREARGILLDYGCGGQPYRELFSKVVDRYVGADVAAAAGIMPDLMILPGEPLAVEDGSIDTVLSTQVLEHILDINFYLAECSRLLKCTGTLIITVPMQWRHHEVPFDYFRFTRFGITSCLTKHGFLIKSIAPCGGVYALLGQIFASHLAEHGVKRKWMFRLINSLALWLDRKIPDHEDTLNWMCIAKKP